MTMARELMDSRRYAKMHLSRLEKVLLIDAGTAVTLTSLDSLVSTSRELHPTINFRLSDLLQFSFFPIINELSLKKSFCTVIQTTNKIYNP